MLSSKIILGLAQSDKSYGLSKKKDISNIHKLLFKYKINKLDTAITYKNSHKIISNIDNKKNLKVFSKLPNIERPLNSIKNEVIEALDKIYLDNKISTLEGILIHNPLQPLDKNRWKIIYEVLLEYKKKGYIKKIGISIYNKVELVNILDTFMPDIIQFPYNIFNQEFNDYELLKNLKKNGIILQARSIFLQGLLCSKFTNLNKYFFHWKALILKWHKFLNLNKLNPEKVCIQFALDNKLIDNIIIGVDNENQLAKNIKYIKQFKNSKKIDYKKFAINDERITDPRLWKLNKKLDKNYSLWSHAKNHILNGGMLLSKRQDQFLPGKWPVYFKKAEKCFIWGTDNKKYLDFSLMGVGTNILGYANKKVNLKLNKIIKDSNISTLNSEEDLKLSKKLISLHKWSSKCFFARTGGEANAIAVRIARAYTGKDGVAICGYHGWHDWYISTNIKDKKGLDKVFLPGISAVGVPSQMSGLTYSFRYNDLKGFKSLIKKNKNIGTIFMEVERNEKPEKNFLKKIREIANKEKIVLIFDECTSGFRENFGGLHKKYNINPDIAVFGKSLGNGIPITAILGKSNIMSKGEKSFISSTFWTDRLGPAAGLISLEEMSRIKSWKIITAVGKKIKKEWIRLSKKYQIDITISGLDAMPMFKFDTKKDIYYKNYITQEMLKKNILCTNTVYCTIDHKTYLKKYFKELDKIFNEINKFENGKDILLKLENPLSKSGLPRLN